MVVDHYTMKFGRAKCHQKCEFLLGNYRKMDGPRRATSIDEPLQRTQYVSCVGKKTEQDIQQWCGALN
jgi:hypothetical protein